MGGIVGWKLFADYKMYKYPPGAIIKHSQEHFDFSGGHEMSVNKKQMSHIGVLSMAHDIAICPFRTGLNLCLHVLARFPGAAMPGFPGEAFYSIRKYKALL